jgi:uncharacterized protein YbjT (DUF2867 family)
MVLVIGGTGVLGRHLVPMLVQSGIPVRVMARSPERAERVRAMGAEPVTGDLTDARSLASACEGVDRVVAAAHGLIGRGALNSRAVDDLGQRALIDAAQASGVQHFVFLSALGASPDHPIDFFRTKYAVEQHLQRSGLAYTILRPTAYMEWHAHEFLGKGIVEKGKTMILGSGRTPVNFVAAEDVARYVMVALTDPRARNRMLEVGGPEDLSKNQVAERYTSVTGKQANVGHVSPVVLRALGAAVAPFHEGIARVMRLAAVEDKLDQRFDQTRRPVEFEIPQTSLDDFIRQRSGLA